MISQGVYVYTVHLCVHSTPVPKKKFGIRGEDESNWKETKKGIAASAHVWKATRRTHNAATMTMPAENVTHAGGAGDAHTRTKHTQFGWFDDM